MEIEKVINELKVKFKDDITEFSIQFGDHVIRIKRESLQDIVRFLKKTPHNFSMLLDLTCVDYIGEKLRFEMVYHLYSISNKNRLRLKIRLDENDLKIDSLTSFWGNANWLEREVFDMYGVRFNGHPDLRRLFMYDGFEGYPLRKDYPLRKRQPIIPMRNEDAD
ncbi:MAG: NADH-quinone oxidoreductase subunit C [Candidatus Aminicenantaceae bacterium]